ncbi:MAG: hypothetical protein LBN27_02465 [Prevotellaceae bacterium]|jgi:hypothetical protein|nr:hypothetical protein [Prevotellaceae bacterium]
MLAEYTFTDKNRDYRTYHTIVDDEGNCYSKILFHKVKWNVGDNPDITDLEDIWAEDIMQAIIDEHYFGDFQVHIILENGEEEYPCLHWEIMDVWDGWS